MRRALIENFPGAQRVCGQAVAVTNEHKTDEHNVEDDGEREREEGLARARAWAGWTRRDDGLQKRVWH